MDTLESTKSLSAYTSAVHSAFRALWSGVIDADQFYETMSVAINRRMPEAFLEGTSQCGVESENDWNNDEWITIGLIVQEELKHLTDVSLWIMENSQDQGGKLDTILARAELWVNRYRDTVNEGKIRACSDMKLEWQLGPTEHCRYCAALEGVVKRASFWVGHNVQPQKPPNPAMPKPDGCGGWGCECALVETTKPITKGSLPGIPSSVWRIKALQGPLAYVALTEWR